MSFFSEIELNEACLHYTALREGYGFVPRLFRAQSGLPRVLQAEVGLLSSIVFAESCLSRIQKESILLTVAGACENAYCMAFHAETLRRLGMEPLERNSEGPGAALSRFAITLTSHASWISGRDVDALRNLGFSNEQVLEVVLTTALGRLLCVLADGLGASVDPEFRTPVRTLTGKKPEPVYGAETSRPYIPCEPRKSSEFTPFAFLKEQLGFVPKLFQAQTLRLDVLEAEISALETILFTEDLLTRIQKELILLAISAANLNTYCVTVHSQILSLLGISPDDSDQIVSDHHQAPIATPDKVLLDFALKLTTAASEVGLMDIQRLNAHAFSEQQILEAVAMAGLSNFLNTVQMGLGPVPDFAPRHIFTEKKVHLLDSDPRLNRDADRVDGMRDPDAEFVARSQQGDTGAFEQLVRRHTRRIFGTLMGMIGNPDDARDALQDVFLKAFEHIGSFQGKAKFSTWLTSIAINSATEFLRTRKAVESLDNDADDETFRPRQLHSWVENPEQLVSTAQMRELVRQAVHRLPEKYRTAVLLRDISQMSTEDAASALGLGVPALKARLLRGRLMLRETLAPHFARPDTRSVRAEL